MKIYPKKMEDGRWVHEFYVNGRGSTKIRKVFKTKSSALKFEREEKTKYENGTFEKKSSQDNRRLEEVIEDWYRLHGKQLRYNEGTKKKLLGLAKRVKNPIARKLTVAEIIEDRTNRLNDNLKPNTVNRDIVYLKGMFNELIRLDNWKYANPVGSIRKLKIDDIELTFLSFEQIEKLFEQIKMNGRNPDTLLVTKICLATGARWSEAETLKPKQILNNRITFTANNTKGRRHRTVPISPELAKELKEKAKGVPVNESLFKSCLSAFREAVERAALNLPEGQMSHVLRHTYASQFIMHYGDIITLQRILGHVKIETTMKYAHLAPDYLEDAVKINALSLFEQHQKEKESSRLEKSEMVAKNIL